MKSNKATQNAPVNQMLKWPDVNSQTKLSRSKVNELESQGRFPKRISLGHRLVVWKSAEIDRWVNDPLGFSQAGA